MRQLGERPLKRPVAANVSTAQPPAHQFSLRAFAAACHVVDEQIVDRRGIGPPSPYGVDVARVSSVGFLNSAMVSRID